MYTGQTPSILGRLLPAMAAAADDTHPIGVDSCFLYFIRSDQKLELLHFFDFCGQFLLLEEK